MARPPQAICATRFLTWQPTHLPFINAPSEPNVTFHDAQHGVVPGALSFYGSASEMMPVSNFLSALSVPPLHFFLY